VALQGTLDTFALPDVLRLLSSTKKTGRLRVSGNRGSGSVWVDGGGVTAAEATGTLDSGSPADVVFELLRYAEGSFTFEAGTMPPDPALATDVEPLLMEAEHQLDEWKDIEAVVPSLDAWVSLVPELPRAEAVVDAPRWRTIVSVGSGTSVAAVGHALGLGEVAVSRLVKELVELGLAQVSAMPSPVLSMVADPAPVLEPVPTYEPVAAPVVQAPPQPPPPPFDPFGGIEIPDQPPVHFEEPVVQPEVTVFDDEPDPVEADEVARQLASLSPKAARAVAAAAKAETDEERDAALAEVTDEDEDPINRGLLLKFLSSVRS
jgi:hypothetical protein